MKMKITILTLFAALPTFFAFSADMASQPWVRMKLDELHTNVIEEVKTFAPTNAATQAWVIQYIAEHGGGAKTNAVTESWVSNYVRTNTTMQAKDERVILQIRAQNTLAMELLEASISGIYALAFSYTDDDGIRKNVKVAERDGGGWTNVVYECGISTNTSHEAVLVLDSLEYRCDTFLDYTSQNVFTRIDGNVTNKIYISYSSVTTNDYKTARGEN